jgi:four helix bundle protein
MRDGPLREKSYLFALKIIRLSKFLFESQREFVLGKQLLRSGTSVGAQVREAEFALTKREFLSKMSIALKEANETSYWLSLLKDSGIINADHFKEMHGPCGELIAMLAATVKTLKASL